MAKGFKRTSDLLQKRIQAASESRGFAQSRLLTHWVEFVGEYIAQKCRPTEISYSKGGMGGSLTILTTGPYALELEMEREKIRAKVNAAYGYNAIARIKITQTAPTGFAEGQAVFSAKVAKDGPNQVSPIIQSQAKQSADKINDQNLRRAIEDLAKKVLTKAKQTKTN